LLTATRSTSVSGSGLSKAAVATGTACEVVFPTSALLQAANRQTALAAAALEW
jgi:hypothetical protein